jgi:hypothetical protein
MFQMIEPDIKNVQLELVVEALAPIILQPQPASNVVIDAMSWNQDLTAVLQKDPSLMDTAWTCFFTSRTARTVKAYTNTTLKFQSFCTENGFSFPVFASNALLMFILTCIKANVSFSFLATIKPALTLLETATHSPTAFTPYIDNVIAGAKHKMRAARRPVKKATPIPISDLRLFLDTFMIPFLDRPNHINAARFRTAFRILIEFHTACRFSCFAKLHARYFERIGNDIIITFPSAKNYHLHEGRTSVLAATGSPYCPVGLTITYFRRFSLRFA